MDNSARIYNIPLPSQKNKNTKKELIAIISTFFCLGLISYLSYDWFYYQKNHIETNNAYVESDVYHVQSRIMGYVKSILVNEQENVIDGYELLQLDTSDLQLEKSVKEMKLKKTRIDYDRAKKLLQTELISKSDFENFETIKQLAEVDYQVSMTKEKYMKVISPVSGVIAKIYVKPGQFIQPGQNLFTIINNNDFWVKANYKETQIKYLFQEQRVKIEIDAFPGISFIGNVIGIYPSSGAVTSLIPPENATGNFTKIVQRVPVKISIQKKNGYIFRTGMSALTSIDIESKK